MGDVTSPFFVIFWQQFEAVGAKFCLKIQSPQGTETNLKKLWI